MENIQELYKGLSQLSLLIESDVKDILKKYYFSNSIDKAKMERLGLGTLEDLLIWLCRPPQFTTFRVNTKAATTEVALEEVVKQLNKQCIERGITSFVVWLHPRMADCLVALNSGPHLPSQQANQEVIVDMACGMAVLRGADVFKQGMLAAPPNMVAGSRVSVFADLDGKCLRGSTQGYAGRKVYVGTGVAQVSREHLFCVQPGSQQSEQRGVSIAMTEPLYQAPSLSQFLPKLVFPQNLPSIVCGHILNPQPGQLVIDMCAAPGGKTTHLACLMKDQGRLIALDKTDNKIRKIQSNANQLGLTCIEAYAFDATKALKNDADLDGGPPYPPNSFDAVLLDGPCSALGQRPAVRNKMSARALASYPKLQRALLTASVSLLRPGGVLVYSTCTVTVEENEEQAAWVLRSFPDMVLEAQDPHVGGFGIPIDTLSVEESQLLQRFDPSRLQQTADRNCDVDTIGFFIAKFRKKLNGH